MKQILQIIKAMFVFIGFNILISIFYSISYIITKRSDISYIISYIISLALIFLINHDKLLTDMKNIKKDYQNTKINIITFTILFFILMFTSNIILYNLFGNMSDNEILSRKLFLDSPILMFITIGILAPIFEELTLRYPYRDIKINKYLKLFIYTILFASMHIISSNSITGMYYIISYIFMSLAFSYAFFKSNNIYGSILIHILNNVLSLTILLIM